MSQTESSVKTDGDPARVEAFDVGWLTAPAALMRNGEPEGPSTRFPVPAYVVETATQKILIDTGLHPGARADVEEHRLVLVDGDRDLLGDGSIELLSTPGHTPGHQSVRVGDLVIGRDVVHFAAGLDDHRFPVFGDDHEAQGRSADRLSRLRDAGLTVLPGHDPDILRPGPVRSTASAR